MHISGLQSILEQPAAVVWPGESVRPDLAQLFEDAREQIERDLFIEATVILDKAQRLEPEGSADMRLRYLYGEAFFGIEDAAQALSFFDQALGLATDASDYPSIVLLSLCAGNATHDALHYPEALNYYEIALDTWKMFAGEQPERFRASQIIVLAYIGRQLNLLRRYEEAQARLGAMLTLAHELPASERIPEVNRVVALGLWNLAMVMRAQSDLRDGDVSYLEQARDHFRHAAKLQQQLGVRDYVVGRLNIQLAEVLLDLAELEAQRGATARARADRERAISCADHATDLLKPTDDDVAKLMARITRLRADIVARSQATLAREFAGVEAKLMQIEYESAEAFKDHALIAKVATLRLEWQLGLGDMVSARDSAQWALEGFARSVPGEATRAERLLRQIDRIRASHSE